MFKSRTMIGVLLRSQVRAKVGETGTFGGYMLNWIQGQVANHFDS